MSSFDGAHMTTFFAPAAKCLPAVSLVRNRPVDSTTTSAPIAPRSETDPRPVPLRRRAYDPLLRARCQVLARRVLGEKQTRRLDHDVGADRSPVQFGRILHRAQGNLPAAHDQRVAVDRHLALEAAVHRVVLQHVDKVLWLEQVVDADDLDVLEVLNSGTENHTPDATEAIDPDLYSHVNTPIR